MARILTRETSLRNQADALEREAGILGAVYRYELAAGLVILGLGLLMLLLTGIWWPALIGGAITFLGVAHSMKRFESRADAGRFRGGAGGEEIVARVLERGLPDSYMVLNDINIATGRKAQCDHIVLGPNGIFVIETKAYSGRLSGRADDLEWTQVKRFGGKETRKKIRNPIPQNDYHIDVLKGLLAANGERTTEIRSIIVMTSRYARVAIEGANVPIVRPSEMPGTILGTEASENLDEDRLRRIVGIISPGTPLPGD